MTIRFTVAPRRSSASSAAASESGIATTAIRPLRQPPSRAARAAIRSTAPSTTASVRFEIESSM